MAKKTSSSGAYYRTYDVTLSLSSGTHVVSDLILGDSLTDTPLQVSQVRETDSTLTSSQVDAFVQPSAVSNPFNNAVSLVVNSNVGPVTGDHHATVRVIWLPVTI